MRFGQSLAIFRWLASKLLLTVRNMGKRLRFFQLLYKLKPDVVNKLLKLTLAGLLLASPFSYGQIEINENLSISGFLDMSATDTDDETTGTDSSSFNLDQAEINFLLNFDNVSGQIDLNYLGDNDDEEFDLEQAFLTYDFGDGLTLDAGKYLSYLGWETFEPTGLYQYSFAYDLVGTIPGHHNGVRVNYGDDFVNFGVSLVDSLYGPDGSIEDSAYGAEAKVVIFPVDGLTLFLGYGKEAMDVGSDMDILNFWASYEIGNMTYAIEWNDYDFGIGNEGSQWLVMANMGITDNFGITARVSEDEQDFAGGETATKFTLSPGWSITDNLGALFEVSQTDYGTEGDVTSFAFETIFTF